MIWFHRRKFEVPLPPELPVLSEGAKAEAQQALAESQQRREQTERQWPMVRGVSRRLARYAEQAEQHDMFTELVEQALRSRR